MLIFAYGHICKYLSGKCKQSVKLSIDSIMDLYLEVHDSIVQRLALIQKFVYFAVSQSQLAQTAVIKADASASAATNASAITYNATG